MSKRIKPMSERMYLKYEYLCAYYAKKIWKIDQLAMDIDDIEQEMKLKLFTCIKAYGKKWKLYKDTGKCKPVPIEYYLKTSMLNKSKDFFKDISKATIIPMSSMSFDFGKDDNSHIDVSAGDFIIDDFNVLDLFKGEERSMMKFHLKGFPKEKIEKIFRNSKKDPIITNEINLKVMREFLINNNTEVREFTVSHFED